MGRLIDADLLMEAYLQDKKSGAVSMVKLIEEAPTVDLVKHGKWIGVMTEEWCTFDECKCSVCGDVEYFNKGWKKFSCCPNCGAKMDEVEE